MATKRYYWLKLKQDFFSDPRIKKLRRIAGGDTYTVILLKLMLLTVKSNGILEYEGIESTLAMELALKMDEDDKNVEATLIYMQSMHLLIEVDERVYDIPQVRELTGSETDSAERKRRQRQREKEAKGVTLSHQGHEFVTSGHKIVTTEIETEKEIEIETDTEIEKNPLFEKWLDEYSSSATNPPAYRAMMRKKILEGNTDAIEAFKKWEMTYHQKIKRLEEEEKIKTYDYSTMVGSIINGQTIRKIISDPESNYLDILLENGEQMVGVSKIEAYSWIHQKRRKNANDN